MLGNTIFLYQYTCLFCFFGVCLKDIYLFSDGDDGPDINKAGHSSVITIVIVIVLVLVIAVFAIFFFVRSKTRQHDSLPQDT